MIFRSKMPENIIKSFLDANNVDVDVLSYNDIVNKIFNVLEVNEINSTNDINATAQALQERIGLGEETLSQTINFIESIKNIIGTKNNRLNIKKLNKLKNKTKQDIFKILEKIKKNKIAHRKQELKNQRQLDKISNEEYKSEIKKAKKEHKKTNSEEKMKVKHGYELEKTNKEKNKLERTKGKNSLVHRKKTFKEITKGNNKQDLAETKEKRSYEEEKFREDKKRYYKIEKPTKNLELTKEKDNLKFSEKESKIAKQAAKLRKAMNPSAENFQNPADINPAEPDYSEAA